MKTHILTLIMALLLVLPLDARAEVYGIMTVVKGDVQVTSKDQKTLKAKIGQKVFPGDAIIANKDSRAKIEMLDKNIINISPDSKFVFQKYEYNPDQNKKGALLNVIYGKIRTTVNQKYDTEDHKFQVITKTSVAGVRGTDFIVSYNQTTNTSKVVTFQGTVEVGSGVDSSGHIQGSVMVSPGHFTIASAHQPPTVPGVVPAQELSSMKESSLAESPHKDEHSGPDGGREPSSSKDKDSTKGGGAAGASSDSHSSGSTMAQMGEDVAAPVAAAPVPKMPSIPFASNTNTTGCAGGSCLPPPVDPSLLHGKTNVIINLQPH